MKKNILLYGVGTFKNRGVEAIINSTLKEMDLNKFEVAMASHDYDYNRKLYKQTKHIKHYYKSDELTEKEKQEEEKFKKIKFDYHNFEKLYQKDVIKEIENSDICISVGGDNYCYPHCTWLYTLDEYAHKLGKKTVLWGASLFEEITDDELINDLNNFDILVIRESLSYNAIKKFVSQDRIIYAPDPAFSMQPKTVKLNSWYKGRKIVAINVSPLTIQNEIQEKSIYDLIDYLLQETKYSILLLPHVTTDDCNDLDILKKIKENYSKEKRVYLEQENYNCNELKHIISQCNILIAARTHASIAAYSTCVPTLVIGYSVKSRGIAKDIFGDYDNYVISKDNLNSENLKDKFIYIEKNKQKIKKYLEEVMPSIKEKSANLFDMVLEKLKEQEEKQICKTDNCVGCGLCSKKCPYKAIKMIEDSNGFIYPQIDLKKCKHCNICRNICPINKKMQSSENFDRKAYAAININTEEQRKSTSGGVFSVLATAILEKNGVVYGSYMEQRKAKHIRVTKNKELEKIRGSKYIQSSITDIYEKIKTDLDSEIDVLFCGTPCQIGAIQAYLGKDYQNLLLVSLICHGVMSQKIFEKYLNELEKEKSTRINKFNFRTKKNKWTQASIEYEDNQNIKVQKFIDNPLMKLYLKNYILRPSCYKCHFRSNSNKADIILGDFWGIEVVDPEMLDENGVSALIINSKKGKEFLAKNDIFEKLRIKEEPLEKIIKYNPVLIESVKMPKDRMKLLEDLRCNNIRITSEYYWLKSEYPELKSLNEKLLTENIRLSQELNCIINSKRWKIMDKGLNKINRLLGRK